MTTKNEWDAFQAGIYVMLAAILIAYLVWEYVL